MFSQPQLRLEQIHRFITISANHYTVEGGKVVMSWDGKLDSIFYQSFSLKVRLVK